MLDPSKDFNSPCYDDTFRRNFYFDVFNAHEEYFIELDYWIMREAYESRIGKSLDLEQVYYDDSGKGEKIFRDLSETELALLASRNYFLGSVQINVSTSRFGDIYKVTELYVYAPNRTFVSFESDISVFPALVETSGNSVRVEGFKYNISTNEVAIKAGILDVGDEFYITRPSYFINGATVYTASTSTLIAEYLKEGYIYAKGSAFITAQGGSIPMSQIQTQYGFTVNLAKKNYAQRSLQVSLRKTTKFLTEKPTVEDRFFPKNRNGVESAEVNEGTIPNILEYKQWMKDGIEINAKPSNLREVFKGLWIKEDFYTVAK